MDDKVQNRLVEAFKLLKEPQQNWTYADWDDWNNRRKEWVSRTSAVMPVYNYPIKNTYVLERDEYDEDDQPGACSGCGD
jgi:hypothetical protein